MNPWEQIEEPETIKVGWRTLVRKTFRQPDGDKAEYMTKDGIGSRCGAVIALTPDNKVIVAEQFRPGPEKILQELPGGGINPDEDARDAVMRELREETGYTSDEVEDLGTVYKDAYTNTLWHFYLAKNCHQSHDQELDEGEFVAIKEISVEQLLWNARNAMMTDTEAVLLAYDQLKELQKENN
jgi:ADP-ribose pyrophosphatase